MQHYDKPSIETDRDEDNKLYGYSHCIDWTQFTEEERRLIECLPHGSGINIDWHVEKNSANKVVCHNSYQVMDQWGYYIGWADFSVRFKANAPFEFRLMFHGGRAQYLARYYGLRQYLEDTIATYFITCSDLEKGGVNA